MSKYQVGDVVSITATITEIEERDDGNDDWLNHHVTLSDGYEDRFSEKQITDLVSRKPEEKYKRGDYVVHKIQSSFGIGVVLEQLPHKCKVDFYRYGELETIPYGSKIYRVKYSNFGNWITDEINLIKSDIPTL